MQTHRSFLEDIIDESVELLPMAPVDFDALLSKGWRLLGYSLIRHNFAICRGRICRTIPLRIRLDDQPFFSKSQRQLLRRNAGLDVRCAPIVITPEKEALFNRHTRRFSDRQPLSVYSFLHPEANDTPVPGLEFSIYEQSKLIACSYVHLGANAVSATYCFFDPDIAQRSLGSFTMLLELELAQRLGKQYYYHGYCYDVPSQFDYKLNFNHLEAMDWKSGAWAPRPRMPVRPWQGLAQESGDPHG
ncbi:MAG: arginine-tRNA-protein transferase [Saprospirales bacterium]|nr:arginine-tRNA-protein transferase [Saprospirales bacterium]